MAGWKKSPSPVTSARDLQLRQETRGLLLADLPRQRLPSPPTFAKCRGSKRRRNRIETPPGFPLKKRSSVSSKTARRNLAQNSRASSTGPRPAFGDCTEAPTPDRVTRSWFTPGWFTRISVTPEKTRYKKFDSKPSSWPTCTDRCGQPRTTTTFVVNTLTCNPPLADRLRRKSPSMPVSTTGLPYD